SEFESVEPIDPATDGVLPPLSDSCVNLMDWDDLGEDIEVVEWPKIGQEIYSYQTGCRKEGKLQSDPIWTMMIINGVYCRTLIDTGTFIATLVSFNLAHSFNWPVRQLDKPLTLNLTARGSTTKVNYEVDGQLAVSDINGYYHVVSDKWNMILANIGGPWDAIVGIDFLKYTQANINFATQPHEGIAQMTMGNFSFSEHEEFMNETKRIFVPLRSCTTYLILRSKAAYEANDYEEEERSVIDTLEKMAEAGAVNCDCVKCRESDSPVTITGRKDNYDSRK